MHALPLVEGQVMVSTPAQALGGLVRGLTEEGVKSLALVANNVRSGTLDGFDNQDGIAIGMKLANALRVFTGDSLTLVSPRGASTPFGTTPRIKSYRVAAIFELGMSEYDKSVILMPLAESQKFFNRGDAVDVLEVIVDDPEKVGGYVTEMRKSGDGLHFADWRQRNESFFTVLEVERNMMFIILSLIVLVAAFNIISGLMMLVKDKGRDIGILRTMGLTEGSILRVFFLCGAFIGVIGTIAGVVLGCLIAWNVDTIMSAVNWLSGGGAWDPSIRGIYRLPAKLQPWDIGKSVALSLGLSFIVTIFPARRAARMNPVEALRYE